MRIRQIPALTEADIQRFRSKIRINPGSGCHEWTGSLTNGYGHFFLKGAQYTAHRVAWVMEHGEPEPGLVIDHACRNRRCVNAADGHLRPLTHAENLRIGIQHNATKIVCPRGHALSGANLIESLKWAGRACRACDVAARAARHRGLKGEEREIFIHRKAAQKYFDLITKQNGVPAAA